MPDGLYYCTNENNTCPKRDDCKRFLDSFNNQNCTATLFKVACTQDNKYVLFLSKNKEPQKEEGEKENVNN